MQLLSLIHIFPAVELIQVAYALYIIAVIHRRPRILELDARKRARALQNVEHRFSLAEFEGGRGEDRTVRGHIFVFALREVLHVV